VQLSTRVFSHYLLLLLFSSHYLEENKGEICFCFFCILAGRTRKTSILFFFQIRWRWIKVIISVHIDIGQLLELKKNYPWERLCHCPCCRGKTWGHGFVKVWLDFSQRIVFLKRFRCIHCKKVFCFRPDTHFMGFFHSIQIILESIKNQILYKTKSKGICNKLQNIWLKALGDRAFLAKISSNCEPEVSYFEALRELGIIPVTRSTKPVNMVLSG